jgi:hypothetical protein
MWYCLLAGVLVAFFFIMVLEPVTVGEHAAVCRPCGITK